MRSATIHKESKPQKMLRLPPVYPRGMEDGRTEGANMAKTAAKLGGIPGSGRTFALLPVVSGSFLLWSPLPGTLYHHLQLLSDRHFDRVLLLGHCNLDPAFHLQPRSCLLLGQLLTCVLVDTVSCTGDLLLALLIFYSKSTTNLLVTSLA